MTLIHTTDASFESDVLRSPSPTIVNFWAGWCRPCDIVSQVLEELSETHRGHVKVARVNVDENPLSPGHYGVKQLPALLLFQQGVVVETLSGAVPRRQLEDLFLRLVEDN